MTRAIAMYRELADVELALALAAYARTSSVIGVALILAADAALRIALPLISRFKGIVA